MAASERSWKMVALLGLVYVLAFLILVNESWIVKTMASEQAMTRTALGESRAATVQTRANRWYTRAFLDSGIQENSIRLLVPSESQKRQEPKQQLSAPLWNYVSERLRVMWTLVYQACLRLSMALTWLPIASVMLVAFAVDGFVARKIKQTNFDYTSPARHRYSVLAIDIAVALFLIGLFLPVPFSPLVLPVFFLLLAVAVSILLANVQKKV